MIDILILNYALTKFNNTAFTDLMVARTDTQTFFLLYYKIFLRYFKLKNIKLINKYVRPKTIHIYGLS